MLQRSLDEPRVAETCFADLPRPKESPWLAVALRVAGGLAVLLWLLPTIVAFALTLAAARARFALVLAWGDVLRITGREDAARRLFEGEARRCEAKRRALRGRPS